MRKAKKSNPRKQEKISCHNTKKMAKKKQKEMHDDGKNAQIKPKNKKGKYCITSSGKRKTAKKKTTPKKKKRRTRR